MLQILQLSSLFLGAFSNLIGICCLLRGLPHPISSLAFILGSGTWNQIVQCVSSLALLFIPTYLIWSLDFLQVQYGEDNNKLYRILRRFVFISVPICVYLCE